MKFDDFTRLQRELRDNGWSAETESRKLMTRAADAIGALSARREPLPANRAAEIFDFEFRGTRFVAIVARHSDGRAGEIVLRCAKPGTMQDADARDLGAALSIALQYGAALEALAEAMTRDGSTQAPGLGGHVLDLISGAPVFVEDRTE